MDSIAKDRVVIAGVDFLRIGELAWGGIPVWECSRCLCLIREESVRGHAELHRWLFFPPVAEATPQAPAVGATDNATVTAADVVRQKRIAAWHGVSYESINTGGDLMNTQLDQLVDGSEDDDVDTPKRGDRYVWSLPGIDYGPVYMIVTRVMRNVERPSVVFEARAPQRSFPYTVRRPLPLSEYITRQDWTEAELKGEVR